jgi:hypothetical protein
MHHEKSSWYQINQKLKKPVKNQRVDCASLPLTNSCAWDNFVVPVR